MAAEVDPVEVDLAGMARSDPQPPWFLVDGLMPGEEITLFAADGGVGKSQFALQLAVCRAACVPFFGLEVTEGGVDFVSFEDRPAVLHWRLSRICTHMGLDLASLIGRLRIFDATESSSAWGYKGYGQFMPTDAFERMRQRIGGPDQLVIVDGLSDVFAGDENDRSQAKAFLRMLRTMIGPGGAMLVLAHVDKAAAKMQGGDSLGYSGSTGWSNGVRSRLHMYRECVEGEGETGRLVVETKKANLAAKGSRLALRFDTDAMVLVEAGGDDVLADGHSPPFRKSDEAEAILRVIAAAYQAGDPVPAATSGSRTAHSVAEAREGLPPSLRGKHNRIRFNRALEQLRQAGAVVVEPFRRPNRHVSEVLNVAK